MLQSLIWLRVEIICWVAESLRPFETINDRGFQALRKTGRPEYHIPSPLIVARVVKQVFVKTRKQIVQMLQVIHSTTIILPAWKTVLKDLDLPVRIIPCDVSTQWNSTYNMLDFALTYQEGIDVITDMWKLGLGEYELSEYEWPLVKQLHDVLKVGIQMWHITVTTLTMCHTDSQRCDFVLLTLNTKLSYGCTHYGLYWPSLHQLYAQEGATGACYTCRAWSCQTHPQSVLFTHRQIQGMLDCNGCIIFSLTLSIVLTLA